MSRKGITIAELKDTTRVSERYPNITIYEPPAFECGRYGVEMLYRRTIELMKIGVNKDLLHLYGRTIRYDEKDTSSLQLAIKCLKKESRLDLRAISNLLSSYMRERMPLFREKDGKRVPIEVDRITQAVLAIRAKKGRPAVKDILYSK